MRKPLITPKSDIFSRYALMSKSNIFGYLYSQSGIQNKGGGEKNVICDFAVRKIGEKERKEKKEKKKKRKTKGKSKETKETKGRKK